MSVINKIPSLIRLLVVVAILGVFVWRFTYNTDYFYFSIGAAALIAIAAVYSIYRQRTTARETQTQIGQKPLGAPSTQDAKETQETISRERDNTDTQSTRRNPPSGHITPAPPKPDAVDVAAWYRQLAQKSSNTDEQPFWKVTPKPAQTPNPQPVEESTIQNSDNLEAIFPTEEAPLAAKPAEPTMPFSEDETTLTQDEKNELVNAVWCRCENPYCKYTSFLGVHHIVDEKNGGSNKLDNLIVLCAYCHDLAHHNEIPEEEMRDWISNREERLKYPPKWKYI